ncbi:MAG: DUF1566 domain-containing protein [Candidatus Schekmanbacteria bacterium]|nr:DUF1566 domain-containing protein [Candidatus Schekmanbacteria bacterium]
MRIKIFVFVLMFLSLFISTALAGGVIKLPQTGQTKCYDNDGNEIACVGTGQDGDIQAGVAWPNPRFTDNADETVSDNLTGLIWAKDGNVIATKDSDYDSDYKPGDGAVYWTHALSYIDKLNSESYLGYTDWRLPNSNELQSLINSGEEDTSIWLNNQGFVNVKSAGYWSSSTYGDANTCAWDIFMWSAHLIGRQKNNGDYYVWPVRSGQCGEVDNFAICLPQTGQTHSYVEGDDAAILAGVAWPDPRFTDNGDETITDNLTGLIWAKNGNPFGNAKTWQDTLDYVSSLNASNYLGYNDWYLPNRNELVSLLNVDKIDQAWHWINIEGFTNVWSLDYWTSTTYSFNKKFAWGVSMADGSVHYGNKAYAYYYLLPVRSGQAVVSGPAVVEVNPNSGEQGNMLDVTISGARFTDATAVSFGSGIEINSFSVISSTEITASISIDPFAITGTRDVSVTTPDGISALPAGFSIITVTVPAKLPDLIVQSINFQGKAKNGKKITLIADVKNIGNKSAPNSSVQFYLSSNNSDTVEGGDSPVGQPKKTGNIKGKKGATIKLTWKVNATPGAYYIKAFCDDGRDVTESDENNNIKSKPITVK